ncbi:MAG: AAA family ATPase [Bacteroidales bacterium]|nr:AAA family ATPase [Bacteroidales bacterium]
MNDLQRDPLFDLAEKYVEETSVSLFLTGKAGTGKTTFLRYIVEKTSKRCVVLAPTGVAAINARGSTIHSFFSLPLCPYLPDVQELRNEYQMPERYRRLRKDKVLILRTLDLLVIDEVSMVRADLMDAVDMTLRRVRRSTEPFGGVQLLMIGDARQLSPVVREEERPFLERVYPSPYFFHSKALQQLPYVTLELQKVYRQEDSDFVEILNAVRDARISAGMLQRINARVGAPAGEDWIRLTTHNHQADSENAARLAALPGDAARLEALVEGEYPEGLYPAAASLELKPGARVMFIRNDPEGRYYNGKLGTVAVLEEDIVRVLADSGEETAVDRQEWQNLQYTLDERSGEIRQEVKGTFRQFPLRPAWAVTVHKSQGLTFDHVVIDIGSAFAFGQVYVALSRCRTLEGISLVRPVRRDLLLSDADVTAFNDAFPAPGQVADALAGHRAAFTLALQCACFSFGTLLREVYYLRKIWRDSLGSLYPAQLERLESAARDLSETEEVAGRFRSQLQSLRNDADRTTERIGQACAYFLPRLETLGLDLFFRVEVDNAEVGKQLKNLAADLVPQWQAHLDTLHEVAEGGFDPVRFRQTRAKALLGEAPVARKSRRKPQEARDVYNDNRHPELVEVLVAWRRRKAAELGVPAYIVLHQKTLLGLADACPATRAEMLAVPGFGPGLWEKCGPEILELLARSVHKGPEEGTI